MKNNKAKFARNLLLIASSCLAIVSCETVKSSKPVAPIPEVLPAPTPAPAPTVAMQYNHGSKSMFYSRPGMPPMPPMQPQNTEKYPTSKINGVNITKENPVSTFAMETDSASYANARRYINQGTLPPSDAVRVEEFLNYFHYDYMKPKEKNVPFAPDVVVTNSPWSKDKEIIRIGLNGYDNAPAAVRPPLNLVLLLDVSGSMSDENKLPLVKKAINMMTPQLNSNDRVSIVVYAGNSGVVLEPTKGNDETKISRALEALQAGGSTAGGEGIELAYKLANQNFNPKAINRVMLMTDGDFNVGITDPNRLKDFVKEQSQKGIYLSVFGFGGDNYNDVMMQALAQNGNGVATYIDTIDEARKVLKSEFTSTMFPIANDVKTQVEFNPKEVQEWRLIGYETRELNREDFNNDKVDAGEVGKGHQVTALYEITPIGAKPSVDPLRYQNSLVAAPNEAKGNEIAFLRIRYKLPNQSVSKLIERPIVKTDFVSLDKADNSTKFAIAVAAFGQKLRNDPWVGNYSYDDIAKLAKSGIANDEFGFKKEFVGLVERAKQLSHLSDNNIEKPPIMK